MISKTKETPQGKVAGWQGVYQNASLKWMPGNQNLSQALESQKRRKIYPGLTVLQQTERPFMTMTMTQMIDYE